MWSFRKFDIHTCSFSAYYFSIILEFVSKLCSQNHDLRKIYKNMDITELYYALLAVPRFFLIFSYLFTQEIFSYLEKQIKAFHEFRAKLGTKNSSR